ncbi:hypothetical protein E2320_020750, partial [Naja naja]
MNNSVREDLYNALLELHENQFEEFKWRLECINYNRKQNIHKAFLDKVERQTVVDLMIQYYEEDAPDVFIHVLQKSNINDIAKKLQETLLKDVDAHQFPDSSGKVGIIQRINALYLKLILHDQVFSSFFPNMQ